MEKWISLNQIFEYEYCPTLEKICVIYLGVLKQLATFFMRK